MTEDEIVGWHQQLDGHESEQAPGVGDGQGGRVCRSPRGHKESDTTEQLNGTEEPWSIPAKRMYTFQIFPPEVYSSEEYRNMRLVLLYPSRPSTQFSVIQGWNPESFHKARQVPGVTHHPPGAAHRSSNARAFCRN